MDWFFIHYMAGSGGKMLASCVTTAPGMHPWFDPDRTDPAQWASLHSNDDAHLRQEPRSPYRLPWFVRTAPHTRGLDTPAEHIADLVRAEFDPQGTITVATNTTRLPQWHRGGSITINANAPEWLKQRRQRLFYLEDSEGIWDRRHTLAGASAWQRQQLERYGAPRANQNNMEQHTEINYRAEQLHPDPDTQFIDLTAILTGEIDALIDQINLALGKPINRQWCRDYIRAWRQRIA